jgi:hypothetical protein
MESSHRAETDGTGALAACPVVPSSPGPPTDLVANCRECQVRPAYWREVLSLASTRVVDAKWSATEEGGSPFIDDLQAFPNANLVAMGSLARTPKFSRGVNYFTLPTFSAIFGLTKPSREGAVCDCYLVWQRSGVHPCKVGIILLAYLALEGPPVAQAALARALAGGLTATGRIAQVGLVTISMAVWLLRHQAYLTLVPLGRRL